MPMLYEREKWWAPVLGGDSADPHASSEERHLVGTEGVAYSGDLQNLWGSRVDGQSLAGVHEDDVLHLPCIDIDHPIRVVPSETPGHHHLFIDVPMKWSAYRDLLWKLHHAGLVELGYVQAALRRGQTHVASKPWKYDKDGKKHVPVKEEL